MVPGSTLMYGSSFTRETLILRDSRMAASEAAAMPFPREETTPPVTKTYLVIHDLRAGNRDFTGVHWIRHKNQGCTPMHADKPVSQWTLIAPRARSISISCLY